MDQSESLLMIEERSLNDSTAQKCRLTSGMSCRAKWTLPCSSSCKGRSTLACQLHPTVRRRRDSLNDARFDHLKSPWIQATGPCDEKLSATRLKFLPEHPSQSILQRFRTMLNVFAQCLIDQTLVVASTSLVHLALEPFDHVIVEPNGNASLSFRNSDYRASFGFRKIVFLSHQSSS